MSKKYIYPNPLSFRFNKDVIKKIERLKKRWKKNKTQTVSQAIDDAYDQEFK